MRIVLTTTNLKVDVWFAAALYDCETEGSVAGDGTVKERTTNRKPEHFAIRRFLISSI